MTTQLVPARVPTARPSLLPPTAPAFGSAAPARHRRTAVVIGHRGASGYRPEHTLAAYELAIALGADAVEPDLVATRDGVLVARHENEIGGTTDVAARAEFADRRTTKVVDGRRLTGWFTEDFTLAELKTLRATERLGGVRPANKLYDGRFEIATLDEILTLVREASERAGRRIGLYLEIKHSTYFSRLGLSLEGALLDTLRDHELDHADSGVWIESFETANLRWLARHCDLPLVQLIETTGTPADLVGTGVTYEDLITPDALADIATYARAVGVHKDLVLPRDPVNGAVWPASPLVGEAHDAGLLVLVWTLRAENQFLPTTFRLGVEPAAHGDLGAEVRAHVEAGVDGIFTDFPDLALHPSSAAGSSAAAPSRREVARI